MPARHLHTTSAPSHHHHLPRPLLPSVASLVLILLLLLLYLLRRRLLPSIHKTAPSSPPTTSSSHHEEKKDPLPPPSLPLRFSFEQLRIATSNFSPALKLGQGGFGPVFRGSLSPSLPSVAIKLMDSSSLQGDLEFRNEISLSSSLFPLLASPSLPPILLPLGFCSDSDEDTTAKSRMKRKKKKKKRKKRKKTPNWFDGFDDSYHSTDLEDPDGTDYEDGMFKRKRFLLVYDLMHNGSLQDALLIRKRPELMNWNRRLAIVLDVARGLRFLHVECDPPVVHSDIKPSNVLLDANFNAKIADFGLARVLKPEEDWGERDDTRTNGGEEEGSMGVDGEEGTASPDLSPMRPEVMSASEVGGFDRMSMESGGGEKGWRKNGSESGKDWWWRQDGDEKREGGGRVKDYVMEWIGSEIRKERPVNMWEAATSSAANGNSEVGSAGNKKQHKSLDWWAFGDDARRKKKDKPRRPKEWWREEFCEELSKKNKKRKAVIIPKSNFCSIKNVIGSDTQWWRGQDEPRTPPLGKKDRRKSRSRGSSSAQHSLEVRVPPRRSNNDFHSGDIPKSGGISSTPSMRGTVCYSAPECGGGTGEYLSEKCDIYSFGVLLLVIVSGRRPLQVTASPMSEFERANLISWARKLAHMGNLLDLVDTALLGVDKEHVLLCITVALLCLQRSPARRPSIEEVLGMLSGELETPQLPIEFSPSPPCAFPYKSRRKGR